MIKVINLSMVETLEPKSRFKKRTIKQAGLETATDDVKKKKLKKSLPDLIEGLSIEEKK